MGYFDSRAGRRAALSALVFVLLVGMLLPAPDLDAIFKITEEASSAPKSWR
jgi:hypothetical protein